MQFEITPPLVLLCTQLEDRVPQGALRVNRRQAEQTLPCLSCRRHDKRLNSQQPGIRSDIAPLSGGFAEEQRQERTCVRDWSGDDRKASGSKRDRSVSLRGFAHHITEFFA